MEVIMLPGCEECQATKGHHKACQHGGTPNLSVDQTVWELKLSASFSMQKSRNGKFSMRTS